MKTKRILILPVLFALLVTTGCKTGNVATQHFDMLCFPVDCGVVRKQQVVKAIQAGEIETLNGNKPVSGTATVKFSGINVFFDRSVRKEQRRNEEITRIVKESWTSAQSQCPDADALIDVTTTTRTEVRNYGLWYAWIPVIGWFGPHLSQKLEYTATGTPIKIKSGSPVAPTGKEKSVPRPSPVGQSSNPVAGTPVPQKRKEASDPVARKASGEEAEIFAQIFETE